MTRKLLTLCFVLVTLFTLSRTSAFAGDEPADANPPCEQCDGNLSDI
jgi:hypothetical protein